MYKVVTRTIIHRRFLQVSIIAAVIVLLVACGGSAPAQPIAGNPPAASAQATQTPDPDETAEPTPDLKPTQTDQPGTSSLEIGTAAGANEFKYNPDTLQVPAGTQKIRLKFTNDTDPKDEVGHNWVLVKPGQTESVLANGISAGDNKDWLNDEDPGIIAHTRLIEGNQRQTITFDSPAPGSYQFICTFPEHYAGGMKGTLTVQ